MSGFQGNDNLRDKRNPNTKNGKVRSKRIFSGVRVSVSNL
jgi:hypothetical protein